jgi:hypothetical protein
MKVHVTSIDLLTPNQRDAIVSRLTKPGSEFQNLLKRGDSESTAPLAIVCDEEDTPLAWAASHQWQGFQTLEAFTAEDSRRRGLALAATVILLETIEGLNGGKPPVKFAVFSPEMASLAAKAGVGELSLFARDDNESLGWALAEVVRTEGKS